MVEVIVMIFVIYFIYKSYMPSNNNFLSFKTLLQKKGYGNIIEVSHDSTQSLITADYNGENYVFALIKPGNVVSVNNIIQLTEYATKNHYHNLILVPGNSFISDTAQNAIGKYNIEVWKNTNFSFSKNNIKESTINSKIDNINSFNTSSDIDDPIQDGTKANSIFGNLFGNKVDKL